LPNTGNRFANNRYHKNLLGEMKMALLNLENTKPMTRYIKGFEARTQYVKGGFRGCYIGLRANFDENLNAWYSIKVGKGTSHKGALGRCDDQALPALFLFDGYNVGMQHTATEGKTLFLVSRTICNLEKLMTEMARKEFGEAPLLYSFAGSTETFGKFQTPKEAYLAAKVIADSVRLYDIESEFTKEPLHILDYFKKGQH
jgi:hypothetical protein